jgi:two-component system response regulator HydG
MKENILIVEDQFIEANNIQELLEKANYRVIGIARSVPKALGIIEQESPDFVLLDIFLNGPLTGIDLAKILRDRNIPFIYLSANSDRMTLEAAKATHPYGFLVKPFREKDVLVMLEIARYLHQHNLESISRERSEKIESNNVGATSQNRENIFYGIIGSSRKLTQVLDHVQIVAPSNTSVLILGENGTGKERIAESIHELSPRRSTPMIKVNCAAFPVNLVESILFGHERGAFTGAAEKKIGKFELAQGSTIFFDEIGEMPLDIQAKFLRALQEKEIERIGSNETIKIDVRIIAATNRNLEKEVAEGRFRIDLYFRLNVFPIVLPPLRERTEDILLLVKHFIYLYSKKYAKHVTGISDAVLRDLMAYHWPGNVRELEHLIERSVLLCEGNVITRPSDFKFDDATINSQQEQQDRIKTIDEVDRDYILHVLDRCKGKMSGSGGAAELLGMNVSTLNSKMKRLGIQKEKAKFINEKDK